MRNRRHPLMASAICIALVALTSCTFGSVTTERPALPRPAVEPDGTFWDAIEASRRGNAAGLLHVLSPRMLHAAFIPSVNMPEPTNQQEFNELRQRIQQALTDGAARNSLNLDAELQRLANGYMTVLSQLADGHFIETGRPEYEIVYTNEHGFPAGPNLAWIDVRFYPKGPMAEGQEPESRRISFVQDGQRWLIEGISNNELDGRFTWPQ